MQLNNFHFYIFRQKKYLFLVFFISALSLFFINPHLASAAPSEIPDPVDFDQDVQLIVAGYGGGYTLDAPVSQVRIFTKSPTGAVTIKNAGHCDPNDRGSVPTTFTLSQINATESGTIRSLGPPVNSKCDSNPISLSWSGLLSIGTTSTLPGHIGYYVIDFTAKFTNPGVSGWNMFSLTTGGSNFISYYAGVSDRFALKASGSGVPGTAGNYTLRFAPPCGQPLRPNQPLEFYDADAGEPNQGGAGSSPVRTVLREYDSAGLQTKMVIINITDGNDAPPATPMKTVVPANIKPSGLNPLGGFDFRIGYSYTWTWEHIYSANGIQFRLPFDSINSRPEFKCSSPVPESYSCSLGLGAPSGTVSANSTYNFNVLALNNGQTTWTGPSYRLQRNLNGGITTYPIASDPVRPNETSNIPNSITAVSGAYTVTYQMLKNGVPMSGTSCTRNFNVTAASPNLNALCTGQPLNLNVGYLQTPIDLRVTNNGKQDWIGKTAGVQDFRLQFYDTAAGQTSVWITPPAIPSPPFANLHNPVAYIGSANAKPRGNAWNVFDTFGAVYRAGEYELKAGLPVGTWDFTFQMYHSGKAPIGPFGDVCHVIVTVTQANPSSATLTPSCTNVIYAIHFNVNVGISPGGYLRLLPSGGVLSPPLPLAGAGNGQDFSGSVDPFNAAAMGQQLYPHNTYTLNLYWHNNSTGDQDLGVNAPLGPGNTACLSTSCSAVSDNGAEPGEPQTLPGGVGIDITNGTNYDFNGNYNTSVDWSPSINIVNPLGMPKPYNSVGTTRLATDYRGTPRPLTISTATYGNITATFTFNGAPLRSCNVPIVALRKPYLKSFAGDVSAGGGFNNGNANNCNVAPNYYNNSAGIRAFANSLPIPTYTPGKFGSSTDFAAYVLGIIPGDGNADKKYGFHTELPNIATLGPTWHYLTFANVGSSIDLGNWGVSLGQQHCVADWFGTYAPQAPVTAAPASVPAVDGVSHYAGALTVLGGVTNLNARPTIVVDGNLRITSNITNAKWGWSLTNLAPYLTLIVRGNIYIDPGVTYIDGLIIAQPNSATGAKGEIVTCANNGVNPTLDLVDLAINVGCSARLTFNGSVIATHIKNSRTTNTLRNAANGETAAGNNAAENYNKTPEMTLSSTFSGPGTTAPASRSIDSIISLPPIF